MEEYQFEIRIRKVGFLGWLEYQFRGLKWHKTFESRKSIDELEKDARHYLDGVIADIETINNFN